LSLSIARWIQSIASHPLSVISILVWSSHLNIKYSKWSLSFRSSQKNLEQISLVPHTGHMSHPSHPLSCFDFKSIWCGVQISWRCSLGSFLLSPPPPPDNFLTTLLSNVLSLFPEMREVNFASVQHDRQNCNFVGYLRKCYFSRIALPKVLVRYKGNVE
jgi:hypothetical protein